MLDYLELFFNNFFDCIDKIHLRLIDYLVINVKAKIATENIVLLHNINNYQADLCEMIDFFENF